MLHENYIIEKGINENDLIMPPRNRFPRPQPIKVEENFFEIGT
jgi:hypothetical protein